ncbi:MAG: hypothetical protein Q8S13_13005, partial [Dehalococcoidia bacterium]|nr:hypothetical protein [Dehalococcoidia bacterium]
MTASEVENEKELRVKLRARRISQHKRGVPMEHRDGLEAGNICGACYALRSNYSYLNSQHRSVLRYQWTLAMLEIDGSGRPFGKVAPEVQGRESMFARLLVEYVRAYNAPKRLQTRLEYGEDPRFFRVHDAGDYFSLEYVYAWHEVARVLGDGPCPVKFWAPTRMWMKEPYRKAFAAAPLNFAIRPSAIHFQDAAPEIPGMVAGSTGNPSEQKKHWNCPASYHDRGSCIGGLSVGAAANPSGVPAIMAEMMRRNPRETTCRACWGGAPS